MASKETIAIIKATVPVLKEHGETITKVFYTNLFEEHPELKNVFNMTHQKKGSQQKVLANAVFQYAVHIDKLEMLGEAVETIAHKHSSLSISKEAYPIVGKHLLRAIKEVLGSAATPEIIDAWAEAYTDLAAIFVAREEEIYTEQEHRPGGFRGQKKFEVIKRVDENAFISSFYLKPIDGAKVPSFLPGQYVAVTVDIPNSSHRHTRNYSISDIYNKEYLRISVKREMGDPKGTVSNFLHETLKKGSTIDLGMPSGNFVLNEASASVVFLAGGIGITPLLSMCKEAVRKDRDVSLLHSARNSEHIGFVNEITPLAKQGLRYKRIFDVPLDKDIMGQDYEYEGYLTPEILNDVIFDQKADYYLCGPEAYLKHCYSMLKREGVDDNNIHFEFFGPTQDITD